MRSLLPLLAVWGCADGAPVQPALPAVADTAADTANSPAAGFSSASTCGECHPRQFAEWNRSMHRYGALSPVLEAMNAKVLRDSGGEAGTFCMGCHNVVGTLEGEPAGMPLDQRSALSREGVTCDVCHTATVAHDPPGNMALDHDPFGPKRGPYADPQSVEHEAMASDVLTSSELCGSCHDVFAFPGLRLEEAFTEYVGSPSQQAGQRCQDCHMGPVPGVQAPRPWGPSAIVDGVAGPDREQATHRFVGPDYSLLDSFPYPEDVAASAQARAEDLLQIQALLENAARLNILDLRRTASGLQLDLEVESLVAGHNIPTGFTTERQFWVAVTVRDATGRALYQSGDLDENLDLRDEHSEGVAEGRLPLDAALVNFQSKAIVLRREYEEGGEFAPGEEHREQSSSIHPHEADFIEKHSLAPLERRALVYAPSLPGDLGPLTVEVALRYRNLPPYLLRDLGLDALVPRLQVFTLDEHRQVLP